MNLTCAHNSLQQAVKPLENLFFYSCHVNKYDLSHCQLNSVLKRCHLTIHHAKFIFNLIMIQAYPENIFFLIYHERRFLNLIASFHVAAHR